MKEKQMKIEEIEENEENEDFDNEMQMFNFLMIMLGVDPKEIKRVVKKANKLKKQK